MQKSMETMLTLDETARVLRLSKSKLYLERKAGRLRTIRFGGTVRVRNEDLRKYVAEAARKSV
jgi:excisionase family DNA binding protein